MKINHTSAFEHDASLLLYLHPDVAYNIINGDANKLILPVKRQPIEPLRKVKSARLSPELLLHNDSDDRDYVQFKYNNKVTFRKQRLPCSRRTVFLCRENHYIFYADEHGCITDGRCGTECMEEDGRKFCIAYESDLYDRDKNIHNHFGEYSQDLAEVFDPYPIRNPIRMKRNYIRLYIVPVKSRVLSLNHILSYGIDDTGFKTKEDFLRAWDAVYRTDKADSWNLHSSHNPWSQEIIFDKYVDWRKAFNPYGYLMMKRQINNRSE